jgi:flagellar M-ring protein FliF
MTELVQIGARTGSPLARLEGLAANGKLAAMLRQFGVLAGIAAAVALGTAVVLWSQSPSYSLLYGSLSDRDISQVLEALESSGVDYRVDHASGAIMVRSSEVHDARLKLAAAGLPQSTSSGFELLQEKSGFGTSQFMEAVRYQHALEAELARTIGQMSGVRAARVHLAIPKQSAFLRDRKPPSASVLVDLHPGRVLEKGQVAAIAHLTASAVPNLPVASVTVVDQRGKLLSDDEDANGLALTERQLAYTRSIEERHAKAVTGLLEKIVGPDAVHVQVAADVDFTQTEQTSESYNPDLNAVRSEQVVEERRAGNGAIGIPGALSNQPPLPGQAPETTAANGGPGAAPPAPAPADPADPAAAPAGTVAGTAPAAGTTATAASATSNDKGPESSRSQTIRNYEVDRTIAHSTSSNGQIRRLSVAVLLRNRSVVDAAGASVMQPWSAEELANFEDLARRAVGFDEARGDSLTITTADLVKPPAIEPLPSLPLWEQAWFWDAGRQLAGASFALLVLLGVLRPAVKSLTAVPEGAADRLPASSVTELGTDEAGLTILKLPNGRSLTVDLSGLDQGQTTQIITVPRAESRAIVVSGAGATQSETNGSTTAPQANLDELERDLQKVRDMVLGDPKLAALIMRRWVEASE